MVSEVSKLKQKLAGDIVVYASYQLVRTLLDHDLVDEVRLTVFPVVLGAGERLFAETACDTRPMRLLSARTVGHGLTHLNSTRSSATPNAQRQRRGIPRGGGQLAGQWRWDGARRGEDACAGMAPALPRRCGS